MKPEQPPSTTRPAPTDPMYGPPPITVPQTRPEAAMPYSTAVHEWNSTKPTWRETRVALSIAAIAVTAAVVGIVLGTYVRDDDREALEKEIKAKRTENARLKRALSACENK